jgi:hypothetical protein
MSSLKFFTRTNSPGSWNLAAYHSPHSLTWRWVLSFSLFRADEGRVWPLCWWFRRHDGLLEWTVRIPFVGFLRWNAQRPMWYRDMYMSLRKRVDQETGMLWLPDSHPEKIYRKPAPTPPNIVSGPGTLQ